MNPERWQLIEDLFYRALELGETERAAYLQRACDGDRPLFHEVEALLRADGRAGGPEIPFLDRGAAAMMAHSPPSSARLKPGQVVGTYRVVREIGRGGMSVVYLGQRSDERYHRQVAIKVLHESFAGPGTSSRFRTECQVLANLEHPNIARLYDAGELADGTPYFVMELVDGLPIDERCRNLPLADRLRLFQKVCAAIHFAHQNLVVHRDIKPSNILVTAAGEPKLLDFGIAKLLASQEAPGRELTVTWLQPMTPEYASPEQIFGERITTASDVYSLGVLLYKLLAGRLPYPDRGSSLEEIRGCVAGSSLPTRPSTAARRRGRSSQGDGEASRASGRQSITAPGVPQRQLSGDLDSIVLKALQRQPEERYASAEQMADDIERHLRGDPVRARNSTFLYRSGKFVRRNWIALSAVVIFVAWVVSFSIATAVQSAQVRRQRQKAEEVLAFFVDLFEVSNPEEPVGGRVTARELLERGVERAERELEPHPEIQATILDTMGVIYGKLGLHEEAQPLLERALSRRRDLLGAEHPDVAASLYDLAALLRHMGELQHSETLARQALEMRRRLLGPRHPAVAETLNLLADLRLDFGDSAAAETLARQALAILREAYGDEHREVVESVNRLAAALRRQGELDEAEPLQEEALTLKRRLLGDRHPEVAVALSDLADLRYTQGRYAEAEPLLRQALDVRRTVWGDEHPEVALTQAALARTVAAQGRLEEAERIFRAALELERRLGWEHHPDYATTINNLASLRRRAGDFATAETLLRQAYALRLEIFGEEHPYICQSRFSLADIIHTQGRLVEAENLYRQADSVCRETLPPGHPHLAWAWVGLGRLLMERGDLDAAEPWLRDAHRILQQALPADHWRLAEAQSALGRWLALKGHDGEAARLLEPAWRQLRSRLGAEDRHTRRARRWLDELGASAAPTTPPAR